MHPGLKAVLIVAALLVAGDWLYEVATAPTITLQADQWDCTRYKVVGKMAICSEYKRK